GKRDHLRKVAPAGDAAAAATSGRSNPVGNGLGSRLSAGDPSQRNRPRRYPPGVLISTERSNGSIGLGATIVAVGLRPSAMASACTMRLLAAPDTPSAPI